MPSIIVITVFCAARPREASGWCSIGHISRFVSMNMMRCRMSNMT